MIDDAQAVMFRAPLIETLMRAHRTRQILVASRSVGLPIPEPHADQDQQPRDRR